MSAPIWQFVNGALHGPTISPTSVLVGDGTAAAPSLSFASATDTGLYLDADQVAWSQAGVKRGALGSGIRLIDNVTLGWSTNPGVIAPDTILARDAANTLAMRNGANAQTIRVYNTYTDASNYERAGIAWSGNVAQVFAEAAGTGTPRSVALTASNASFIASGGGFAEIWTNGTQRWYVGSTTGHFLASTDNTYDIGAVGATRPRDVFAGGSIYIGQTGQGLFAYLGTGFMFPSDGIATLRNWAGTGFSRLQFGGTTSSFPSLKRTGAIIDIRLADDSDFTQVRAQSYRLGAAQVLWFAGTGDPEGVHSASPGSLFSRTDGGAGTTLYVKESGTGSSGWVAK